MGSFGKLAKRALDTDMPVMVQVRLLETPFLFVSVFHFLGNVFNLSFRIP